MRVRVTPKKLLLPSFLTGLAAVYLAYVIYQAFSIDTSIDIAGAFPAMSNEAPQVLASTERQKPDYSEISQWHLFGQSEPTSIPGGEMPVTQLQLKLQGVLATSKYFHHAHAIIQTPEQIQKAYKINDQLPGGAILKTIEHDKVIILRDNQHESLSLEKLKPE